MPFLPIAWSFPDINRRPVTRSSNDVAPCSLPPEAVVVLRVSFASSPRLTRSYDPLCYVIIVAYRQNYSPERKQRPNLYLRRTLVKD